jgi:hypothetical protein
MPQAASAPETGATVADARRLARSARLIAVFYWTGPGDERHCLFLERSVFLKEIRSKPADQAMPCRMSDDDILMIGISND